MSPEQEPGGTVWKRRPLEDLVWTEFDSDYVVYHRPSGKTHLLNEASFVLLNEVLSQASSFAEIAEIFAPEAAGDFDQGYLARLDAMIRRLEHLGLVERA